MCNLAHPGTRADRKQAGLAPDQNGRDMGMKDRSAAWRGHPQEILACQGLVLLPEIKNWLKSFCCLIKTLKY